MEGLVPPAGDVLAEDVLRALLRVWVALLRVSAVAVADPVVVAGDEELGDGAAVGVFVAWEHGVPCLGYGHEVFVHALVRHVAGYRDGVDALCAEPFKRVLEREVVAERLHLLVSAHVEDVDVGDNAEAQARRLPGLEAWRGEEPATPERAERRGAADEEPS